MPFPFLPVGLGAGVVGLLLLTRTASAAPPTKPKLPVGPTPVRPPTPRRPHEPPNPPPGSGCATVAPYCPPGSQPGCANGLLVHSVPNSDPSTRVGPENTGPNSPHALRGEVVAVIDQNVPDQSTPATSRVWWQIMTPLGNVGYVSGIGTDGRTNFTNVTPPSAPPTPVVQTFAGISGVDPRSVGRVGPIPGVGDVAPYSMHHRRDPRYAYLSPGRVPAPQITSRCAAPAGCWLRPGPNQRGGAILPSGAAVQVLRHLPGPKTDRSSPGQGGWAHVRSGNTQGWMLSEWLAA